MANSSFVVDGFLSGEWSQFAQGRITDPLYKKALNVCRNSFPLEEGAWIRRSGTRYAAATLNGSPGRVIPFPFEQAAPYIVEFTDGKLRMFAVATQTSGLATPLPSDFRLVTTNDNQQVLSISTANPAVVQTGTHGWTTGDQVQFLFATTVAPSFTPLLRARVFKITVTDSTHFSLADPLTGANIDGSTLGWSAPVANTVIVVRMLAMTTPYTAGSWSSVRKVQAETQAVLLHGSFQPQNLKVNTLPTASAFATFNLTRVAFTDGPYLDPPTDGTVLTPNVTSASQGTLPTSGNWTAIGSNGTIFVALAANSNVAATSSDGLTWVSRTLPSSTVWWQAIAWNGTVFCAIAAYNVPFANTTVAATSPDGITWTARTLSTSGTWNAIAWNGTVFCVVGNGSVAMTSPDGITWTNRTLPVSANWAAIAWNSSVFAAIANAPNTVATSPDGITWTQRTLPVQTFWTAMAWNGSIFAAIGGVPSDISVTSPDGITWTARVMPTPQSWSAITANGSGLFSAVSYSNVSATSPDGITWTARKMPLNASWDGIAWNGTTFCAVASGSNVSAVSATGAFSVVVVTASSPASINNGSGFLSTDVGRLVRLFSEPLLYQPNTAYVAGNAVKFNNVYYINVQAGTGKQPDISPTFWSISAAAAIWTWGAIVSITSPTVATIALSGLDLLYTTQIATWRLGVYSNTSGWPTCGTYHEGRLWLSGAVPNRVDASVSNQLFNMAPTAVDGTVAGNNAISYTFNSDDVNPIFWMVGTTNGILAGTQSGEWVIVAPTTGPITPTNIAARRTTNYGAANVEPVSTQLTISFVQRFTRKLLEHFPDALSGRFTAPNLAQNAKHLTKAGIAEIRYQQEPTPIIWNRMVDGTIAGTTYERESLFSSQPAKFVGWHRHDFGNSHIVESIAVGPSTDGAVDTLVLVEKDPVTNIRHVTLMNRPFEVSNPITSSWFQDDAVVPSGGVITAAGVNSTLTFYGLWHLNGQTVTVSCGGVDVGDFAVANGAVTVPIDNDVQGLFTTTYLQSISSTTAYGAAGTQVAWGAGTLTVPAVVGFTYTSQGQILRPDTGDARTPPGQGKPGRVAQIAVNMAGTQGISFGTSFSKLHPARLKTQGGNGNTLLTLLQLFTGICWQPADDDWGFDSMVCWQISRPYPGCVSSLTGFMETVER